MAIAFDNAATAAGATATTSASFTCTGSDLALVVFCLGDDTHTGFTATYNGVSMTDQGGVRLGAPANNYYRCFTLLSPATGSNTLSVTNTLGTLFEWTAASYTGVTAISGFGTGTNSGATIARSTTISADNSWVVSSSSGRLGPHDNTASTGVTNTRISSGSYVPLGDSGTHNISASPVSHTWSNVNSAENIIMALSLEPATGGGGGTTYRRMGLLGVGQ